MSQIYDISLTGIAGDSRTLNDYRGKVLLIVNTASKCGFTPQYQALENLYRKYQSQGLEILGFPCNQFGAQEQGSEAEIAQFCELNFGVSFPLFSKIDVNGDKTHPLFVHLKKAAPGMLGSQSIKWNFTKFLIGRDGKVRDRFAPTTDPAKLEKDIEALLAEKTN
ncbi:glutathione peroxidase [Shewanella sp.]|uniref:glutathione peroxidase n=1 Tax=Shewanella sp. TaxID=50422 RepID=UPI003565F045